MTRRGRRQARRNRGKALVGGKEPKHPTPQPALLPSPGALPSSPISQRGSAWEPESEKARTEDSTGPNTSSIRQENRGAE